MNLDKTFIRQLEKIRNELRLALYQFTPAPMEILREAVFDIVIENDHPHSVPMINREVALWFDAHEDLQKLLELRGKLNVREMLLLIMPSSLPIVDRMYFQSSIGEVLWEVYIASLKTGHPLNDFKYDRLLDWRDDKALAQEYKASLDTLPHWYLRPAGEVS